MSSIGRVDPRPLVVHVMYRFAVGGLENGVVNLINRMAADRFRHAVVALTEVTSLRDRIDRDDVQYFALSKGEGHGWRLYPALLRLFLELKPAIVHTRNLAALEATVPAWAARVPVRIHGEHGRDVDDLDGSSRKYQMVRRLYRPFVHRYVALSRDLEQYLVSRVGVPRERVTQIYNGVDANRFAPAARRRALAGSPFNDPNLWVVGTVGRMQGVKDQTTLARAFVRALEMRPAAAEQMRLVMVGDGPLRAQCEEILRRSRAAHLAWFTGERSDIPALLQAMDCFVLPSLAEGISNTILEAMASGLPVVATRVGGNAELIDENLSGMLVPPSDPDALARAMLEYFAHPQVGASHGRAGRGLVERRFSLDGMVECYASLYSQLLTRYAPARLRMNAVRGI